MSARTAHHAILLGVALTIMPSLASCTSASQEPVHCRLTITLAKAEYQTAGEVMPEFGPASLSSVIVLQPGPRILAATEISKVEGKDEAPLSEREAEIVFVPPGAEFRVFELDTGLWTSAWDGVSWEDAEGNIHIPPGWYRIQLVYSEKTTPRTGDRACVAVSASFHVLKESIWQRYE